MLPPTFLGLEQSMNQQEVPQQQSLELDESLMEQLESFSQLGVTPCSEGGQDNKVQQAAELPTILVSEVPAIPFHMFDYFDFDFSALDTVTSSQPVAQPQEKLQSSYMPPASSSHGLEPRKNTSELDLTRLLEGRLGEEEDDEEERDKERSDESEGMRAEDELQAALQQQEAGDDEGPHDLVNATKPSLERRKMKGRPKRGSHSEYTGVPPVGNGAGRGGSRNLRERASVSYQHLQQSDEDEEEEEDGSYGGGRNSTSSSQPQSQYKPHIKHFDELTSEDIANIDFKQLTRLMKEARLSAEQVLEVKATRRKLKNRLSARTCSTKKRETCTTLAVTNTMLVSQMETLEREKDAAVRASERLKQANSVLVAENAALRRQLDQLMGMGRMTTSFVIGQGQSIDLDHFEFAKPLTPS